MIKSKIARHVTLKEEAEAAKLEQEKPSKPMSAHGFKKWLKAHDLLEKRKPIKEELEQIQKYLYQEMDRGGVDQLTRRGIVIFARDEVKGAIDFDIEGLKRDYPAIYAKYNRGRKDNFWRVNWKSLIKF
jgi:hypothetical protein